MSKDEKEAIEEIIKRINERNEIGQLEDGYNYYFPSGKGGISSATLRIIAEELDRINLPYDTEINEYFKQEHEWKADTRSYPQYVETNRFTADFVRRWIRENGETKKENESTQMKWDSKEGWLQKVHEI